MRERLVRAGLGAALAGGVFFGGRLLMDETLTRHDDVESDSVLEVEMTVAIALAPRRATQLSPPRWYRCANSKCVRMW